MLSRLLVDSGGFYCTTAFQRSLETNERIPPESTKETESEMLYCNFWVWIRVGVFRVLVSGGVSWPRGISGRASAVAVFVRNGASCARRFSYAAQIGRAGDTAGFRCQIKLITLHVDTFTSPKRN